jgi:enoyl-CoA hydratase/carnithine racemase
MSTVEEIRDGPVTLIRMNRPEVHNALDPAMLDLLLSKVRAAVADPAVRAIVLTGGPRAFTTGEDLATAAGLSDGEMRAQADHFQELATALRFAPQPVVAAVCGYAYGGGLEIAVNCDLRIAGANARFACPEVEWSLTLSNGSSVLLRRLIGEGWTRELLLFGTVLDAHEAARVGLVTRVVPVDELEEHALGLAHKAATYAPGAVRLTKELLNADPRPWQQTLDAEGAAVMAGFGDEELQERLRRFADRKKA